MCVCVCVCVWAYLELLRMKVFYYQALSHVSACACACVCVCVCVLGVWAYLDVRIIMPRGGVAVKLTVCVCIPAETDQQLQCDYNKRFYRLLATFSWCRSLGACSHQNQRRNLNSFLLF